MAGGEWTYGYYWNNNNYNNEENMDMSQDTSIFFGIKVQKSQIKTVHIKANMKSKWTLVYWSFCKCFVHVNVCLCKKLLFHWNDVSLFLTWLWHCLLLDQLFIKHAFGLDPFWFVMMSVTSSDPFPMYKVKSLQFFSWNILFWVEIVTFWE